MSSERDPVGDSVEAVAELHRDHDRKSTWLQRRINGLITLISRPTMVAAVIGLAAIWLVADIVQAAGRMPEFVGLDTAGTLGGLFVALLILATERRQDQLAERRERLMLELALLADKKNAKIIALLEELRRDAPNLVSRPDPESDAMARPTDPQAILEQIDDRTRQPKGDTPK